MKNHLSTLQQFRAFADLEKVALENRGYGYADEFQAFISRLKSGGVVGKSDDPRINQAKRLWDLGVGRELNFRTFEEYLETVPKIPAHLLADNEEFPLLVFEEARIDAKVFCILLEVGWLGTMMVMNGFVSTNVRHATSSVPRWIRMNTGMVNHGKDFQQVLGSLRDDERGVGVKQGLCCIAQYPDAFFMRNHENLPQWNKVRFPGSVSYANHQKEIYLLCVGEKRFLSTDEEEQRPSESAAATCLE